MDKLIIHELGIKQNCPYCDNILIIKQNVYSLASYNHTLWRCKKCGKEYVEIPKEVNNANSDSK